MASRLFFPASLLFHLFILFSLWQILVYDDALLRENSLEKGKNKIHTGKNKQQKWTRKIPQKKKKIQRHGIQLVSLLCTSAWILIWPFAYLRLLINSFSFSAKVSSFMRKKEKLEEERGGGPLHPPCKFVAFSFSNLFLFVSFFCTSSFFYFDFILQSG